MQVFLLYCTGGYFGNNYFFISQLSCFLNQDVRYIHSGIKNKMIEEIEKKSSLLDRNARYQKTSLISRLPAYLSVQIVRFYYKEKEKVKSLVDDILYF